KPVACCPGEGGCCFREAIDCEGRCRLKPKEGLLLQVHYYPDVYDFGGLTRVGPLGSRRALTRQRQHRVGRLCGRKPDKHHSERDGARAGSKHWEENPAGPTLSSVPRLPGGEPLNKWLAVYRFCLGGTGATNPTGRVRCKIAPIARRYNGASHPFLIARLRLLDIVGLPRDVSSSRRFRRSLRSPGASGAFFHVRCQALCECRHRKPQVLRL